MLSHMLGPGSIELAEPVLIADLLFWVTIYTCWKRA
jgi:hypothetical protein